LNGIREGSRKEDGEKGGKKKGTEKRSRKTVSTLVSLSKLQQQQQHLKPTPQQPHGNSN